MKPMQLAARRCLICRPMRWWRAFDLTPGSDLGDASDEEKRTRRRLLDMAREAEKLLGTRDEKLKKAPV